MNSESCVSAVSAVMLLWEYQSSSIKLFHSTWISVNYYQYFHSSLLLLPFHYTSF